MICFCWTFECICFALFYAICFVFYFMYFVLTGCIVENNFGMSAPLSRHKLQLHEEYYLHPYLIQLDPKYHNETKIVLLRPELASLFPLSPHCFSNVQYQHHVLPLPIHSWHKLWRYCLDYHCFRFGPPHDPWPGFFLWWVCAFCQYVNKCYFLILFIILYYECIPTLYTTKHLHHSPYYHVCIHQPTLPTLTLVTCSNMTFYCSLVKSKNVINTLMMSYAAMGVVCMQWVLFGYSFAFGPGSGM